MLPSLILAFRLLTTNPCAVADTMDNDAGGETDAGWCVAMMCDGGPDVAEACELAAADECAVDAAISPARENASNAIRARLVSGDDGGPITL